ncbi:hypothetical protein BJ944DRAFT_153106, partial [Cunninghamella echinulata]
GMNGLKNVTITNFQLPANDPNGGIQVELGTLMNVPSPIGIQLGTIALQIGYEGVNLGQVVAKNVSLVKGENILNLKGTIKPLNNTDDLKKVGQMFSTYVSGGIAQTSAIGVSAAPDGHTPIQWLSQAFQTVQLNVGLSNQGGAMKIIHAVNMGHLDLKFDANNPYSPTVSAPNVMADFSVPFGFSLNITQATQNITMNTNKTGDFAQLIVPWSNTQSDQKAGKLQFAINQASLSALNGKNNDFNDYTYALTASDLYQFGISGIATTKTSTPIGDITLGGITFSVPTALRGLQFLNSTPTAIKSIDMMGGTKEALQLNIGVSMGNPSDFSLSVGDVIFNMFSGATQVGTVTLANLTLQRGENNVIAKANFDPNSSQEGQQMLTSFVMGKASAAAIGGFEGSTPISSLAKALSDIKINTELPGLSSALIQNGVLKVLPDTVQTGVVNVAVNIANPFTADLSITSVKSSASFNELPVGNIDQDITNNPISVKGHSKTLSPQLNMKMNLDPTAIATLIRGLAVQANLDTKPIDALFGMGGIHVPGQENVNPDPNIFKGFDISKYTMDAMKALKVNLALETDLHVGEYVNKLSFSQNSVPIQADKSVTGLIPILGNPIVQHIVDQSILSFETLILSDPTNKNAKVQMKGSIKNTGPMDATIEFPTPLTVQWQGKTIGTASMPALKASAAKGGADFDVPSQFTITDIKAMEEFAIFMINSPEFEWAISSNDVSVTALGFTFKGIKLNKAVKIKGCSGFKGAVTINSFDLPSNDPAGGITLIADTTIVNPSQVGFSLGSAAFNSFYKDVLVGPLAASPANFAPLVPSKIKMKGRMVPQKTKHGLDMVTEVFVNYLSAKNSILSVIGDSATGAKGEPVTWLTNAFKTIKIENVILPGPKEKPTLIPSINMMNMQLDFTKNPYAAPASSTKVQAQLKNPFGFPLGVSQLNMEVDVGAGEHGKMAHLSIPTEKATTDKSGLITTQFTNVPFTVADDSRAIFGGFLAVLTKGASSSFGLTGSSNALTSTAIGDIQLNGITFDVKTSMKGFNNFNGKNDIISLDVSGGNKDYAIVTTTVAFTNPSEITITIGDVNFSAKMKDGSTIGQVFIKNTIIKPGVNQYNAEFRLAGTAEAIGKLFTSYLTNVQVPLTIFGTKQSTSIEPLVPAMETVQLATTMKGIQANLVANIKVKVSLGDIIAKKSKSIVTLRNPLKTPYTLTGLKAKVFFPDKGGEFQVGHIDSIPGPCTVPAGGETTCDEWNVAMDAEIGQLLKLVGAPDKSLNLKQDIVSLVGGPNGYSASFYYFQNKVPTSL